MGTKNVFIVDKITFKYHLEYMFVGTGKKENYVYFNNSTTCNLHLTTENNLLEMIADRHRVRLDAFDDFNLRNNTL